MTDPNDGRGAARGARWVLLAALAAATTAWAQAAPEAPAPTDPRPAQKEVFRGRELIDFTDPVEVQGQIVGPDGKLIAGPPRLVFKPIIQLRHDWNDEMKASVDGMK